MNINTILLIILILIIISPELRKRLNKIIIPLFIFLKKCLIWLGLVFLGIAMVSFIIWLFSRIFKWVKIIFIDDLINGIKVNSQIEIDHIGTFIIFFAIIAIFGIRVLRKNRKKN